MDARSSLRSFLRYAALVVPPLLWLAGAALAHTVAEGDQDFVRNSSGPQIVPFIYLGAKHMVTGYDHLLFLAGVIFFLYRLKEVALYVTLFAIGHSCTLLLVVVLTGLHVNPFLIDAIIGLSVVYKALDNMDAFRTLAGREELEYKATLALGEPMPYSWRVQGGPVYFEFHGEPTEGKWPAGYYRSYQIQERASESHGSFIAPFTGQHGRYWRNLSDEPAIITLQASGYYSRLGRIESKQAAVE